MPWIAFILGACAILFWIIWIIRVGFYLDNALTGIETGLYWETFLRFFLIRLFTFLLLYVLSFFKMKTGAMLIIVSSIADIIIYIGWQADFLKAWIYLDGIMLMVGALLLIHIYYDKHKFKDATT